MKDKIKEYINELKNELKIASLRLEKEKSKVDMLQFSILKLENILKEGNENVGQ